MSFTHTFANPPRLYIMAGVPGCGKTTWSRRFFDEDRRVSTDEIREELWSGEPYDAERNPEVFRTFHLRLGEKLHKGDDAVADATNLSWLEREKLIAIAAECGAETHLIFFKNHQSAIRRNAEREGNAAVPVSSMVRMLAKFNASLSAILEESYTSITIIEDTV